MKIKLSLSVLAILFFQLFSFLSVAQGKINVSLKLTSAQASYDGYWDLSFLASINNEGNSDITVTSILLGKRGVENILNGYSCEEVVSPNQTFKPSFSYSIYYGAFANWADLDYGANSSVFFIEVKYTKDGSDYSATSLVSESDITSIVMGKDDKLLLFNLNGQIIEYGSKNLFIRNGKIYIEK